MQTRATFLRRTLAVAAVAAFAPTRLGEVVLPDAGPRLAVAPHHPLPVGTIQALAGPIPDGWIECDGRTLTKADHLDLYAVLGTAFGGYAIRASA